MDIPFEYVFPAIRGIQAGREYYVSMCPLRLIPKLFSFDDEEIPPEMRAQRTLNKSRVPEIAKYILHNPTGYIFSAITASINAKITFESIGLEAESQKIGRLRVPMDAPFIINDGQHRRAAFELALKENPELGYETIAVVFFLDIGLERSQQMFTDLNRYAAHPDPSLNILYDHRDKKAILARSVVKQVKVFRTLTHTERSTLPTRSGKLFTLSSIYNATLALLANYKNAELEQQIELAIRYWEAVSTYIPDWEQVLGRKVSAGEMRQDYVHSHAIALAGLGGAGATLISIYPDNWQEHLQGLQTIDWLRSNPDWEGRIMHSGRISKARTCVSFMTAYIKKRLELPLTVEEERLETTRMRQDKKDDDKSKDK
ncbi:MAG: DNA sulfur modification protein DndB [Nostoc sp. DedVER02]|uniref:DNA sulfur modification protein DndB n=1 Tax=unclassified Nostoc TaxID=2593658 RepID=UPI002AD26053|nr:MULTISPECIES: DNA sulfur modification protein DndB [unclassified Nostoc]MDZ7987653.1 DNA sulfur modification protein DndB [Nostoc sp. DedVER02]MDZ8114192.1 DNA sulfur modification protein DndB [Nostoc sp. DedVER01b]